MAKADCVLPRRAVRGDVVTFTHDFSRRISTHDPLAQSHASTQEVPANCVVHRIRSDLFWEDVVSTAGLPVRRFNNGLSLPSLLSSLPCPLFLFIVSSLLPQYSLLNFINTLFRAVPENRQHSQAEGYSFPFLSSLLVL